MGAWSPTRSGSSSDSRSPIADSSPTPIHPSATSRPDRLVPSRSFHQGSATPGDHPHDRGQDERRGPVVHHSCDSAAVAIEPRTSPSRAHTPTSPRFGAAARNTATTASDRNLGWPAQVAVGCFRRRGTPAYTAARWRGPEIVEVAARPPGTRAPVQRRCLSYPQVLAPEHHPPVRL